MKGSSNSERRRYPRFVIELPVEYQGQDDPHSYGGIVVNASETGFLFKSSKDIPVGTELDISILYLKGFQLDNFKVTAKIVRKEPYLKEEEHGKGFQYGLELTQILDEDRSKLNLLLGSRNNPERVSYNP